MSAEPTNQLMCWQECELQAATLTESSSIVRPSKESATCQPLYWRLPFECFMPSEEKTLCLEEEFGHVPVTTQNYLYPSEAVFFLTSPPMGTYSCPGSNIIYTCVLSSSALGVITAWSGSVFQCPPTNQIGLLQRLSGIVQLFTPQSCGSLSAVTTNVTSTCYTSVLTIPAVQALNGATVGCYDGNTGTVVGSDTVKIMLATSPGPVGNMTVTSPSVDQLTVTWTPPTTGGVPTNYSVTISSPVVIADNGSPVYSHTFTGLVSDTLYTVSVLAINCAGSSNGTSLTKWTLALPPAIKAVSVFNPNNTLHHLEITWTPVGGAVTIYGVYLGGGIHGYTSCTTPQCFYVVPVSVASTSYVISVASVNKDGDVGPKSTPTIYATIGCSFSTNQSFYCMVCCSTDPSVPPDSSVYNISTTRGTEVTVSLQGLTSGQMYYCKAAATNTISNNCAGPVVGGVKVFFTFMTASVPITSSSSPTSTSSCGACIGTSTAVGISVAMTFIFSFSLGGLVTAIIICGCYNPRRFSSKTTKSPPPVPATTIATYEMVGFNKKEGNTIELVSNSAYGTGRH
eukprot:Em0006g201a